MKLRPHAFIVTILVVVISGCVGEGVPKEVALEEIKAKLSSYTSYSCDAYDKCDNGPDCEKEFYKGRVMVDKVKNKLKWQMGDRVVIFDGGKNELLIGHPSYNQYDKEIVENGTFPLKNEDVVEKISVAIDYFSAAGGYYIREGDFLITPTGKTIKGIILESDYGSDGSNDTVIVFYADTLLIAYDGTERLFFDNCQENIQIPESEFILPSSYQAGFVYNHNHKCTQDSDCNDNNSETKDSCYDIERRRQLGFTSPSYCQYHFE